MSHRTDDSVSSIARPSRFSFSLNRATSGWGCSGDDRRSPFMCVFALFRCSHCILQSGEGRNSKVSARISKGLQGRPTLKYICRLLSRVKQQEDGCWLWQNAVCTRNGYSYGRIRVAGVLVYVHRLSYLAFKGDLPQSKHVHHTCHNTLCVNPDHLAMADAAWNTAQGNRDRKLNGLTGQNVAPF